MTQLHAEQDAIKQAVEGGYAYSDGNYTLATDCIFQDPAFWQALGKARGWGKKGLVSFPDGSYFKTRLDQELAEAELYTEWMTHALRYFETLLSGGDMKAFWQSLP